MTIYADVLVAVNVYIMFFLIRATACVLRTEIRGARIAAASIAGGFSALVILLPPLSAVLTLLIKCAVCALLVLIAFGFGGVKNFLVNTLFFLLMNLIFCGVVIISEQLGTPFSMSSVNGYTYIDVSFLALTLSTAAAYFIIAVIRRICTARTSCDSKYCVIIENCGGAVTLTALSDSGNKLTDIISGLPVIVCDYEACREILPPRLREEKQIFDYRNSEISSFSGLRILPAASVGGNGCIPAFRPRKITVISTDGTQRCKSVSALIGLSAEGLKSSDEKAILNPKIMI